MATLIQTGRSTGAPKPNPTGGSARERPTCTIAEILTYVAPVPLSSCIPGCVSENWCLQSSTIGMKPP